MIESKIAKEILHCEVISPMLSHGNLDNGLKTKPELRSTELKALMRQTYRMAKMTQTTTDLFQHESIYFGDAQSKASPISIQMYESQQNRNADIVDTSSKLFFYKEQGRRNPIAHTIQKDSLFDIILRYKGYRMEEKADMSIRWYINLLKLSAILGGIGGRSRRGRGCFIVPNMSNHSDLLDWMVQQLNNFNDNCPYKVEKPSTIKNKQGHTKRNHPIIEEIRLGKEVSKVEDFLQRVDKAAHEIKQDTNKYHYKRTTGFAESGKRFASSLIVSITKTKDEKLIPVYTFVEAIQGGRPITETNQERDNFVKKVEKEG
ncbi:RAMP superfamily CRISPR-associated protein [Gracilibacillus timonensis]|uniref:RAMP superfamily CRISPR-associated protein n=1 Tax=Gracilibacillus timonensis TaxID=1816696 RepID=UPI00082639A6|nr:RAMP superfamily CRISPR-associated protein [Gracilibacillus timonensis]